MDNVLFKSILDAKHSRTDLSLWLIALKCTCIEGNSTLLDQLKELIKRYIDGRILHTYIYNVMTLHA